MATNPTLKAALSVAARQVLGGVFVAAGALKLTDPATFAADIGQFRLLPVPASLALAVWLPWIEVVAGAAVLWRRRERGGLLLLTALAIAFSLALASAWWRGLDLECGCFGAVAPAAPALALARSAILAGLGIFLLHRLPGNHSPSITALSSSVCGPASTVAPPSASGERRT